MERLVKYTSTPRFTSADTFLRYEGQYTYDPKPREFFLALQAPDAGTGPNSALRNIIFLIGCNFLGGPWTALEPVFLKRARRGMEDSLAKLDRLIDFIEASMLLSGYQFLKGRCDMRATFYDFHFLMCLCWKVC